MKQTDFTRRRGWENLRTLVRWLAQEEGIKSRDDLDFIVEQMVMEMERLTDTEEAA